MSKTFFFVLLIFITAGFVFVYLKMCEYRKKLESIDIELKNNGKQSILSTAAVRPVDKEKEESVVTLTQSESSKKQDEWLNTIQKATV